MTVTNIILVAFAAVFVLITIGYYLWYWWRCQKTYVQCIRCQEEIDGPTGWIQSWNNSSECKKVCAGQGIGWEYSSVNKSVLPYQCVCVKCPQ